MNKAYLVAPLTGLVVFGAIFGGYNIRRTTGLAAQRAQAAAAEREKFERDQTALIASRTAAATAAAERQQARLVRERREADLKAAQVAAEQRRTQAFEHERKLGSQIAHRRSEVARVTEALAILTPRQRELEAESTLLADYLERADPNREAYYRLLEKLETADRVVAIAPANANPAKSGAR